MVSGRAGLVRENWFAEGTAPVTVRDAVPLFVAVTFSVLPVPTVTLPKFTVDPLRVRLPLGDGCFGLELEGAPALNPWHPTSMARESRRNNNSQPALILIRILLV